jgi:hypothetical protein
MQSTLQSFESKVRTVCLESKDCKVEWVLKCFIFLIFQTISMQNSLGNG